MSLTPSTIGLVAATLVAVAIAGCGAEEPSSRFFRGNTHTHTLWSDGDGAPERVARWYVELGYDFLVLSDHNILSTGERWFPVRDGSRLTPARVEELIELFGEGAVELRDDADGGREMRLVTLDELKARFETPGEFLFLQGEEITDSFDGRPVHVNAVHLAELIEPQGGDSVRDVMNRNVDAVAAQGRRLGRPTLAHVNHPNFGWAVTWEDIAAVRNDRFFEVYNGHNAVRNEGDAEHFGTEAMWDLALARRLTELDLGPLYGLATDDSHHYFEQRVGKSNSGRGWVQVRATELTPEAILGALREGEFYASTGVELTDFGVEGGAYEVDIDAEPGLTYTTRFIGTRMAEDGAVAEVGARLAETTDDPARYELRGDELYVRAVVESSRPHPNPSATGERERAWTQPVVLDPEAVRVR